MNHPLKKSVFFLGQQRLLLALMQPWRKEGRSLLQLGAGLGLTAEFLLESGMDLTIVDEKQIIPENFPGILPRMEIRHGQYCDLPFEDLEFDYALINHQYAAGDDKQKSCMIREAMRIARHGLIIVEWNRLRQRIFNFPGEDILHAEHFHTVFPWDLSGKLRKECSGMETTWLSTMLLGRIAGTDRHFRLFQDSLHELSMSCTSLPLGAVFGVRIQWKNVPLSPLGMLRRATASLTAGTNEGEIFGRSISRYG